MKLRDRNLPGARVLILAFAFSLFGCSSEPTKPPVPILPSNDTPENTIVRFVRTYERGMLPEYEGLLTGDFTYEFSGTTDPNLAQKWSAGWFAGDESTSTRNLFLGGTNQGNQYLPAASSIDIAMSPTLPVDDSIRDPKTHKVLLADVNGQIVLPPFGGNSHPTIYPIKDGRDRFLLVRGDSARTLAAGQPADTLHWYIWKWMDETAAPKRGGQSLAQCYWGLLRDLYR